MLTTTTKQVITHVQVKVLVMSGTGKFKCFPEIVSFRDDRFQLLDLTQSSHPDSYWSPVWRDLTHLLLT